MSIDSVLTNQIAFRWDQASGRLLVTDISSPASPKLIARVDLKTLDAMSFPEASRFLGEFVTLLVPVLRARFASESDGSKGSNGEANA